MKISVVGLGKLGSPLVAVFASKGYEIIGIDINAKLVAQINQGMAPVEEPSLQEYITAHRANIKATQDYDEAILNTDVTFVIVPTPSQSDGSFSNRYVLQAIEQIGKSLTKKQAYHLVVITSTVMPGSTDGEIRRALESASDRIVGDRLGLCYNPEFIALGTVIRNMLYPDMILIGESDKLAGETLESIYRRVCQNAPPFRRMNLVNAELTKIAVNTFVTTKISYANMLSDICQRLEGADAHVVTDALGLDSRIGNKYLSPAVAFGGPCFPRDNIALGVLAHNLGARADIALATQDINKYQNVRLLALIDKYAASAKVGILGLSYKAGTYVIEESQGVQLANQLSEKGFQVSVYDPIAMKEAAKALLENIYRAASIEECLRLSDTIFIMIPWPEFVQTITPELLKSMQSKKVIVDCWRLLSPPCFEGIAELLFLGCGKSIDYDMASAR